MTTTMSDQERIAIQREVVAEHIQAENDATYDVVEATFVQADRSYFDCVPGAIHFDGQDGINAWYQILGSVLPDLHIDVSHEWDAVGCSLREMTAYGTHSAEFGGIPASGRFIKWEAIALYIFDREEPGKLIGERAYWDNDSLLKQMKGEEAPPLLGLLQNPDRIQGR